MDLPAMVFCQILGKHVERSASTCTYQKGQADIVTFPH